MDVPPKAPKTPSIGDIKRHDLRTLYFIPNGDDAPFQIKKEREGNDCLQFNN